MTFEGAFLSRKVPFLEHPIGSRPPFMKVAPSHPNPTRRLTFES